MINNSIYDLYGDRWYTAYDDPIALLRAESKAKLPWVLEKIKQNGKANGASVLDVGCGAGFLTNALALDGFKVTGVDASEDSLKVARAHDHTESVWYVAGDAYTLPFDNASFDVVTAMDFLEHVDRPQDVIKEIARVLRPQGLFFYHTFNRNILSYLIVIKMVEWLVKNTPKDMHILELFIKPKEIEKICKLVHMEVKEVVGLRPVFSTIPIKNYFTGVVPENMRFKITSSTLLSYLGYAIKNIELVQYGD